MAGRQTILRRTRKTLLMGWIWIATYGSISGLKL